VGKKTGATPTERGKRGGNRRGLPEGHGVPLGLVVAGAKRPDMKLLAPTLYSIVVERPEPSAAQPQGLCLDKMVESYEQRIAVLAAEVAALRAQLTQTSQNSSRPPSMDGPHGKR